MVRRHTTLSVEDKLIKEAKEHGINISQFLEENLSRHLGKLKDTVLNETLKQLMEYQNKTQMFIERIREELIEREEQESIRQAKIINDIESCPELLNLSEADVQNNSLLSNLIDVVRERHNVKVGISQIREYYSLMASRGHKETESMMEDGSKDTQED